MQKIDYRYGALSIPGGGYVTGFSYHPSVPNLLYIRTDIGGSYKFDSENRTWNSVSEACAPMDLAQTYPVAITLPKEQPETIYIVGGEFRKDFGRFCVSKDGGKNFTQVETPFFAHGNLNGRGTGNRMIELQNEPNALLYASQMNGLWKIKNEGDSFEKINVCNQEYLSFVWASDDGKTILVGSAGISLENFHENWREKMWNRDLFTERTTAGLYVSYDSGVHFEKLPHPETPISEFTGYKGFVPHRYSFDGTHLYITMNETAKNAYQVPFGYSADGGQTTNGRLIRYTFTSTGTLENPVDITPNVLNDGGGIYTVDREVSLTHGFGGVCVSNRTKDLLIVGTMGRKMGEILYLSKDAGETWEIALYGLVNGRIEFETTYMKPKYNGNYSLIHWLSDVKFNPFSDDEVWFNTGTGVYCCRNFMSEDRVFTDECKGIEETVHLNVYSPVDGPMQCIDIVGDLGGFVFPRGQNYCDNSYSDEQNNRYITCINADYSDLKPECVVVAARGNWVGSTKGGIIRSYDYGRHFERIPFNYGISAYLDEKFHQIECPNTNPGFIAMDVTTENLVFCTAENDSLPTKGIVTSNDAGKTFYKTKIFALDGTDLTESDFLMKVFADRTKPETFYGFGEEMRLFVSIDAGKSFQEIAHDTKLTGLNHGFFDGKNETEIRGESGKIGVFYCACGEHGLYKLQFVPESKTVTLQKLTKDADSIYCVGLGILSENSNYLEDEKALYVNGIIDGRYGFYRSFDDARTFEQIDADEKFFGQIQGIDADKKVFGRYYIATRSFGLKYGEPCNS